MMIVHDPSRVKVATTYPFSEYGINLDELVNNNDAIGGNNERKVWEENSRSQKSTTEK